MDYKINKRVSFNVDLKYLTFDADVEIGALGVEDELRYDAVIIGAGLGYRF
jgi:outer membrane protein W